MRWAIGGILGGSGIPAWHGGGGPGVYFRVGAQTSELLGIDFQGSAASLLLIGAARGAVMVDFTPVDWFSIGTGASVHVFYASSLHGSSHDGALYAVPARLTFHPGRAVRTRKGARGGVELLLEGDVGAGDRFDSNHDLELGIAVNVGVGYAAF